MRTSLIVCALASATVANALECTNCCLHKDDKQVTSNTDADNMDCSDDTRRLSDVQKMAVCCRAGEVCCKAARYSDSTATCCREATHECKSNKCVARNTDFYTETPTPAPTVRKSTMTQASGTNTGADATRTSTASNGFTGTSCYANCGKTNRVTAPPTAAPATAINYNAIPQYTYQYPTQQYAWQYPTQQSAYPATAAPVYQPFAQQYTYPTVQFRSGAGSRQAAAAAPVVNRGAVQYPQYNFNFAPAAATCSCDDECTRWNDCCNDKTYYCPVATGRVRSTAAPRPTATVLPAGLTCDLEKARHATWTVYGQAMATVAESQDVISQVQTKTNKGEAEEIAFYAAKEAEAKSSLEAARKAVVMAMAASANADDAYANNEEGRTVRSVDESCHMANKVLQVSRDLVATSERYWKSATATYANKKVEQNKEDDAFKTLKKLANNVLVVARYVHARTDAGGASGSLNALAHKIDDLTGRLVEYKADVGDKPTSPDAAKDNWDDMMDDDGIFAKAISALNKAAKIVDSIKFHGHRHLGYAFNARQKVEAIYEWIAAEEHTFAQYARKDGYIYNCPGIASPTQADHGRAGQTNAQGSVNLNSWYNVDYADVDGTITAFAEGTDCGAAGTLDADNKFRSFQSRAFREDDSDGTDKDEAMTSDGDATAAPKGNANVATVKTWNEKVDADAAGDTAVSGSFSCVTTEVDTEGAGSIKCSWDLEGLGAGISAGFSLQENDNAADASKISSDGGEDLKLACFGVGCAGATRNNCKPDDLDADDFMKSGLAVSNGRARGSKTIKTCGNVFDLTESSQMVVIHDSNGNSVAYGEFESASFAGTVSTGSDDFDVWGYKYGDDIDAFHGTIAYPTVAGDFTPKKMMGEIDDYAEDVLSAYRTGYQTEDVLHDAYSAAVKGDKDGLPTKVEDLLKKYGKSVETDPSDKRDDATANKDPRSYICNERFYDDEDNALLCEVVTIANTKCSKTTDAMVGHNSATCSGLE